MYLVVEHALRPVVAVLKINTIPGIGMVGALLTFMAVTVAWVFFRAPDMTVAASLLSAMFSSQKSSVMLGDQTAAVVVIIAAVWLWHRAMRHTSLGHLADRAPRWLIPIPVAVMIVMLLTNPGDSRAFIYFQF